MALLSAQQAYAQSSPASPFDAKKLKGVDTSNRRELTDEEIQNQIFKTKPKQGATDVFMPVFYEQMNRALTRLKTKVIQTPGAPSTLEVDSRALLAVLDELVVSKWVDKFKALRQSCDEKTEACIVPLSSFNDPEVKIEFDEAALEVRIHVPPELRAPRSSSMFRYALSELDEPTNEKSYVSSFVNINASDVIRSKSPAYKDGRDPLNVHLDSGTRIGRVVIDASGRYSEQRDEAEKKMPAFVREDVRAVTDFQGSRLRIQAGDLNYPVKGFQLFRPMAGVALFTQFSLDPSNLTLPGGNYEVYLARPSKVMVYINDQMIQVLDLPAGRHNLRDFPFNSGLNDLRLEIMDDMGRTEVQRYTYFSSADLLKPGLNEVTYAVGQPSIDNMGERSYKSDQTTISASHRHGFSQWLTLGANVQRDPEQMITGLEALFSSKIGYFSLEPAYSTNTGRPSGYAGKLRYVMQEYIGKEKNNRFTALEVSTRSPYFSPLGSRTTRNFEAAKVQATHSRAISKRANINFSTSLQLNRALDGINRGNSFNLNLGVAHRWANGLSTNLSFRHTSTAGASDEIAVMGFLVWAFTEERQFVTASYDSGNDSSRADWTYQPSMGVGGFTAQANVQRKQTGESYGGVIDYAANRARLNVTHEVELANADPNEAPGTPRRAFNTTNVRLGTALVFAGGHFAISRPVTDSFALLYPLDNLRGQNVKVNPQMDESYLAQTDWLGPAVAPEISSYSLTPIQLGQKNLKTGTVLPHDHFLLRPSYRSGYAIEIGSDATVYLTTTLLIEEGKPGSMLAGQVYYLDDTSKEPVTVFTNRAGLLRSEGFRHGHYRLEIPDYQPFEFTIPESAGDTYAMPPVQLKAGK